jgi:mandelate racemase/muconate lactonizing enzyme-like protein
LYGAAEHVYDSLVDTYPPSWRGRRGLVAQAYSAVDLALSDLKGKAAGLPLYKLLGGARESAPAYGSDTAWLWMSPEQILDASRPYLDQGLMGIKVKVGSDPEADADRKAAVAALAAGDRRPPVLRPAGGDERGVHAVAVAAVDRGAAIGARQAGAATASGSGAGGQHRGATEISGDVLTPELGEVREWGPGVEWIRGNRSHFATVWMGWQDSLLTPIPLPARYCAGPTPTAANRQGG